jgi:hypothetical protein
MRRVNAHAGCSGWTIGRTGFDLSGRYQPVPNPPPPLPTLTVVPSEIAGQAEGR